MIPCVCETKPPGAVIPVTSIRPGGRCKLCGSVAIPGREKYYYMRAHPKAIQAAREAGVLDQLPIEWVEMDRLKRLEQQQAGGAAKFSKSFLEKMGI